MAQLDFYFDFGSPTAYIAYTALPKIAEAAGVAINWRPMLLGGVFKATGNTSPVLVAAKGKWMMRDIVAFCDRFGLPPARNKHFPINTLPLMRGAMACQQDGRLADYIGAMFQAIWVDGKDMNDMATIGAVLSAAGFDPHAIAARIGEQEIKDALIAATEEAVARGIFGAPTIFVDDDMYFGQDRLPFVAQALGVDFNGLFPDYLAVK